MGPSAPAAARHGHFGRPPRTCGRYAPAMSEERLHETIVESRVVHRGNYVTFRVDTVEDPDGGRHVRDIVEHPGAVAVVAFVGEDLLLVRQYRLAAGRILLEIPAGTLDRQADGTIEDPADRWPARARRGDRLPRRDVAPPGHVLDGAWLRQRGDDPLPGDGPVADRWLRRTGA